MSRGSVTAQPPVRASSPVATLASELVARPSVTPDDAGCQALIAHRLEPLGFRIEHMPCGEVANLWARYGDDGPLFAFAGHTDVVPPGPLDQWRSDPFAPVVRDGFLHGRGAADMKGSVAAMVVACERFLERTPAPRGSLALLLTSDEEGPAVDGTRRVVEALQARGEHMDWCLVGEPSSTQRLGDLIRVGRRGSLAGTLTVRGIQGHVAYPEQVRNPIHLAAPLLAELADTRWDEGDRFFPATSFQVSNVHAGTGAENVVPGSLTALFNFRYGTASSAQQLRERVQAACARHCDDYTLDWRLSGEPFLTGNGELVEAVCDALEHCCGARPALSTGGGTSDGRFIAPTGTQVVELGPCNQTIHKVDERVGLAELDTLATVYEQVLQRLLGA